MKRNIDFHRYIKPIISTFYILFALPATFLFSGFSSAHADASDPNHADASDPNNVANFNSWAALATGIWISPAMPLAQPQDLTQSWIGADGQTVQLLVRQPAGINKRVRYALPAVAPGADARVTFQNALLKAVKLGANTLSLAKGATYNFLSVENANFSHFLIQNMSDFIIEGNGATLNFVLNDTGLLIQQSQRLRVENLKINYTLLSTSIGQMVTGQDGHNVLVINNQYPVNANTQIAMVTQIDPVANQYISGGGRMFFPPPTNGPVYLGNQTFQWPLFDTLPANSSYLVTHYWYGGQAIRIDGFRTATQTEDITFSGVTIRSTPGVGINVTGLKRGFAFVNSTIAPDPNNTANVGSSSWDGIYLVAGGGDILIQGNTFNWTGDDAINVAFPVHRVIAVNSSTNLLTLTNSSRFINNGDQLAFFDGEGQFLGTSQVVGQPVNAGNYKVTVDAIQPNVAVNTYARNVSFLNTRFFVDSNVMQNINGHGVLAQIPNGLVSNNSFNNLNRNAIRLLSSIGYWNEGVGAFNVAVRGNSVSNGGMDIDASNIPWSSITAYGQGVDGNLSTSLMNQSIEISGNTLLGLNQGCLSIALSDSVSIFNNVCQLNFPDTYSTLTTLQSYDVNSY